MPFSITMRSKQKGQTLLAMMLIFITASSYVLVSKLNANQREFSRKSINFSVLNQAKAALIGYAIRFPEIDAASPGDPIDGPGYLPCPDINNNGAAGGTCTLAGGTTIGRVPWRTLDLGELRDSDGERLWYAVSDNYKNNPMVLPQLNSDSAGNFSVDGNNDIVAVIFAPGAPFINQDRSGAPLNVASYLEDSNADGDTTFVTQSINNFNDTLVTITRQELMAAVEKRILAEVQDTISTYQLDPDNDDILNVDPDCAVIDTSCDNAFPWLSNFSDPSTSLFRSTVGARQGHLPFHWSSDPDSITQGGAVAGRNPFTTDITLSWAIVNATAPAPATSSYGSTSGYDIYDGSMVTPGTSCTESSTCVDDNYPGNNPNGLDITAPIVFAGASCTWTNKEVFQCTGTYVNTIVNAYPEVLLTVPSFSFANAQNQWVFKRDTGDVVIGAGGPYCFCWQTNVHTQYAYTETIVRTYTIDITFTDSSADGADIQAPTAAASRTRDVTVNSADTADALYSTGTTAVTITINDRREIDAAQFGGGTLTWAANSTRTLTNDTDTSGSISAAGILYDIDIDGYDDNLDGDYLDAKEKAPELPEWFVENGWQELIYLAYPTSEVLPGGTTACTPGTDCLTVNVDGTLNNNVRATVLAAGVDLTPGTARPNGNLTDYFDNAENTDLDEAFSKDRVTINSNDQTRIISTAP